jgi:fumarate reductase flavoprotein subunit
MKGEKMGTSEEKLASNISRRGFLKGAVSTTGAIAVSAVPYPGFAAAKGSETDEDPYAFLQPLPEVPEKDIVSTVTKDIIVVGAGNCGHVAALTAATEGASVFCVEKYDKDYFNSERSAYGGGYPQEVGTVNSKWMMKRGAPYIPYENFANQWQRQQAGRCNPDIIRDFYWHSGETIDWLISDVSDELMSQACGFMCPPTPEYTAAFPDNSIGGWYSWIGSIQFFTRFEKNPDGSWPERKRFWLQICLQHIEKAKKLGAEFAFGQAVDRLIQNDKGDVIGCIAVDSGGKYHKYLANKGVILACGGFEGNLNMVLAFANQQNLYYFGYKKPTSIMAQPGSGEAIEAAIRIGGLLHLGPTGTGSARVATLPFCAPFPQFNGNGERFANEFNLSNYAAQYQLEGLFCQIGDNKWREYMKLMPYGHGSIDVVNPAFKYFSEQVEKIVPGDPAGGYVPWTGGAELNNEGSKRSRANTWCANTLSELLDLIGYSGQPKANILAGIERYNKLCAKGHDDDYGKPSKLMWAVDTPPFYGASGKLGKSTGSVTWSGGLAVDKNYNVRDRECKPIKGLFAAGNAAGGKMVLEYGPVISGIANGTAITTGRLAALSALGRKPAPKTV